MSTPSATTKPIAGVVFFDGVCGLCDRTVNTLMSLDKQGILRFAPLQGQTAAQIVPEDVRKNLNTFVFACNEQLYYRSTALAMILIKLGGLWRLLGGLLWIIPRPLRDLGYRMVSASRYRIFGRSETCRMPTPQERSRFLD